MLSVGYIGLQHTGQPATGKQKIPEAPTANQLPSHGTQNMPESIKTNRPATGTQNLLQYILPKWQASRGSQSKQNGRQATRKQNLLESMETTRPASQGEAKSSGVNQTSWPASHGERNMLEESKQTSRQAIGKKCWIQSKQKGRNKSEQTGRPATGKQLLEQIKAKRPASHGKQHRLESIKTNRPASYGRTKSAEVNHDKLAGKPWETKYAGGNQSES